MPLPSCRSTPGRQRCDRCTWAVVNAVSLYVERGKDTFHSVHAVNNVLRVQEDILREELIITGGTLRRRRRYLRQATRLLTKSIDEILQGENAN